MADEISRRQFLTKLSTTVAATTVAGKLAGIGSEPQPQSAPTETGAVEVTLKINGQAHKLMLQPRVTLLDALRERLQITGAKRVCDRGTCGACTVLKDGKPIYGCMMLAVDAQGSDIRTVESFGSEQSMSAVQKEFVEKDALMCGFCTPGFVTAIHAALAKNPNATMADVRNAVRGNICRCGTFNRVFEAAWAARGAK